MPGKAVAEEEASKWCKFTECGGKRNFILAGTGKSIAEWGSKSLRKEAECLWRKASQQAVKIEGEGMFCSRTPYVRVYKIDGQFGYCIEHLPIFHTPGCVGGGYGLQVGQ